MFEKLKTKDSETLEKRLEIIVAIFLAIVALLTAWAAWIGSLHGGNQATNYAKSNNLSAEGNSMYNEAQQTLMQDMLLWNDITELQLEVSYAQTTNDADTEAVAEYKLYYKCMDNLSDSMADALGWDFDAATASADDPAGYVAEWLSKEESQVSPFTEDFTNAYYTSAQDMIMESDDVLKEGQDDNRHGDAYNLVTVLYSVVLFLLGIAGTFKSIPNRKIIVVAGIVGCFIATVYMFTIPLPTGFSLLSFF